jgi:hypothetical protein
MITINKASFLMRFLASKVGMKPDYAAEVASDLSTTATFPVAALSSRGLAGRAAGHWDRQERRHRQGVDVISRAKYWRA